MGIPATRSVWSASSLLALSLSVGAPKAGASWAHSKRFAPRNVHTLPQYVTELTFQGTKRAQRTGLEWLGPKRFDQKTLLTCTVPLIITKTMKLPTHRLH